MSITEEIIDVLVVVDADTIISEYGTNTDANNPVQITDSSLIFMVTKQADAVSGNAGNELKIGAKTLDTIRWRETSLSLNAAYSALLYKFVAASGGDLISSPMPLLVEVKTPLPDSANPTSIKTQIIESYFWNSTVLEAGSVTYHFNFMILDQTGAVQGYFWWDPFIKISD